ncbi:carbamoyl phosphate synthase small subunit [Pontibacillus halophilus JSM 076056 = DSM 19796]|uniref:Carbamoyl phosphate synthase small chain n=1 Tax=Pontibacillus halophilus JSM 076056 = DSM 19796 TaxID=1385510 RepID=A0A0A5IBM0_9BACI|nr:carbamoyl phosphate synthase small subunit [Pontibacillus halophilus]KGX93237.1 carbamoyl phosphate synthase small subunit [Pontibacillus halophilus JSM 076056 = DSM 19796]
MKQNRKLVLEDGTFFVGEAIGSDVDQSGEVVFNTGMTGYQEIITDPSYCGQIVTFTYPMIGNYGFNRDDYETVKPSIHGVVVKEANEYPSNFRNEETLHEFLSAHGIPGIQGVDTRKLTKHIRKEGSMKGAFTSVEEPIEAVVARLRDTSFSRNVVARVSTIKPYVVPGRGHRVVLVDFGMKHGILREFTKRHCHVTVVPYNTSAEEIRRLNPDGVLLSNGPGDPKDVQEAIEMVRTILEEYPTFGICLGHQLIALACGANTEKMKFGHRGSNHPVKHIESGSVYMTSQNHGYAVVESSLSHTQLEVTQYALNDGTVEGLAHLVYPCFSAQYHPESAPGPEDSNELFDEFIEMMEEAKGREKVLCQNVQI